MAAPASTGRTVTATRRIPVRQLHTHPANPRRGDLATIQDSLQRHGQYRAIVVNADTMEVLAGNHTLKAAVELGWDSVLCHLIHVESEEHARQIMLVDNRSNDLASYDEQALADLLDGLPDLEGTGFDEDALNDLLAAAPSPDDTTSSPRYTFDAYDREQIVDAAVAHYRATGFPYTAAAVFECMIEINALRATPTNALASTTRGYRVADAYHPHRWEATVAGMRAPLDTFADDDSLRAAIEQSLDYNRGFSAATFAQKLAVTRGTQAAANFRPAFALALLRQYAPTDAVVLDTSTGYGGRLVGFLASDCREYIGFDPARRTHEANRTLVADLCPPIKTVELHCTPIEDADPSLLHDRCDIAFTSPPYFAKERYSDESTQSWVRYPDSETWRDGFLMPMIRQQFAALKSGATNLVNVNDVKIGSHRVPLVDWTLDAARTVGFTIETIERYRLQPHFGAGTDDREALGTVATEPVVVMRKP